MSVEPKARSVEPKARSVEPKASSIEPEARRVLLTGASGGVGTHLAKRLRSAGHEICLTVRAWDERAVELQRTLALSKDRDLLTADLSCDAQAAAAVEQAEKQLGGLDTLINAAGSFHRCALASETPDGWRRAFDDNLHSAFYASAAAAPLLRDSGRGRIINFTLAHLERQSAPPNIAAHYCAKSALLALTRAFASELGPSGATVNAIALGFIDGSLTEPDDHPQIRIEGLAEIEKQIPAGRVGTPTDVGPLVEFLISSAASYINGAQISVSGGW
jgi:3-oxoacyl-[acyl-carrier protein] reductase